MARIRSIKPEFPQSETIGALSRDARLLFVQLWTLADDEGRARAASRMLASLLYPYDTDAGKLMDRWLDELEEQKCIQRYEVEGSKYLEIVNWLKHQKIDKPSKSRLPAFVEGSRNLATVREASTTDLGSRTLDLGSRTNTPPAGKPAAANDDFEEFKKAFPKREGSHSWPPARKLFEAAVKRGEDPKRIIAAARAGHGMDVSAAGTRFIPQAETWLRKKCYEDYLNGTEADTKRRAEQDLLMEARGYFWSDDAGKWVQNPPDPPPEPAHVGPIPIPALRRA
jgi:hypothetical protein